jgi:hypothetical protein
MSTFRLYLAISIIGFLVSFGLLVGGLFLIYDFNQLVVGIVLLCIGFFVTPFTGRLLIRFIQARKAYLEVKKLKDNYKTNQLLKLTNIGNIRPTRIEQLRILFSVYALVDLGEKAVIPVLVEQYKTAKQNNYRPEKYYELLEKLAEKTSYESADAIIQAHG